MILTLENLKSTSELDSVVEYNEISFSKRLRYLANYSGSHYTIVTIENKYIQTIYSENEISGRDKSKISDLRKRIKTKMSGEEIEKQLDSIRKEWQRDI